MKNTNFHVLFTEQSKNIPEIPLNFYPRPALVRDSFLCLNGKWDFSVGKATYDRTITVPYCPESALSGICEAVKPGTPIFYKRSFCLPDNFNRGRIILHFGAVDCHCEITVNGKKIGVHSGGYDAFSFDITEHVKEQNLIEVKAWDDLDGSYPYGKQKVKRGGMWYTPVTGIWQTVWIESVPENYIKELIIEVDNKGANLTVMPSVDGVISCEGKEYSLQSGKARIEPDTPELWSPENPRLYRFTLTAGDDRIESYFSLRTLEIKDINGFKKLCLNGNPYFFHGVLDQGYFPEGIFTPADEKAFERDILTMKRLGFNTLRKHIKVEPQQFYYDCDRLGMIVFQDFVNNSDYNFIRDTALPTVGLQRCTDTKKHIKYRDIFMAEAEKTIKQLKNHSCVCYWTIFNEGWGQFDSTNVYRRVRELDSSRFIDSTSGWFRCGESDVESLHVYFKPVKLKPASKPLVLSEFGGYSLAIEGHISSSKSYGYGTFKDSDGLQTALDSLYTNEIVPAINQGLCATIITQLSDVEDEINGMVTYDRKVVKVDEVGMKEIAEKIQSKFKKLL